LKGRLGGNAGTRNVWPCFILLEGTTMELQNDLWSDAEVISTYTRRQAIEDGVLVDLMQPELVELVHNAGFKFPVAMTADAFFAYVRLSPAAKRACNDIKGRLWDVLWMLSQEIRKGAQGDTINFKFYCVTDRIKPRLCTLKAVCGPGDEGAPVITIMHPWED
jgi:hypothetical protein